MPCVLFIQTTIIKPNGGNFAAPFRVPQNSLEAFVEHLANDGVAMVEKLSLNTDNAGTKWVMGTEKVGLGLAAIATVQTYQYPVRELPQADAA